MSDGERIFFTVALTWTMGGVILGCVVGVQWCLKRWAQYRDAALLARVLHPEFKSIPPRERLKDV